MVKLSTYNDADESRDKAANMLAAQPSYCMLNVQHIHLTYFYKATYTTCSAALISSALVALWHFSAIFHGYTVDIQLTVQKHQVPIVNPAYKRSDWLSVTRLVLYTSIQMTEQIGGVGRDSKVWNKTRGVHDQSVSQ